MEMGMCVFYANWKMRWLIYNGFQSNWRQRELIKGRDIIEWYRQRKGGSACSALKLSISLHLDKTPPPLIMSIFHVHKSFSSLVVLSCTELHIILHLAKSCIDPALYLISMHYNVLCTVHPMSVFEIRPLGDFLVYCGWDIWITMQQQTQFKKSSL